MTAIVTSVFVWSAFAASAFVSVMFLVNLFFFRKATVPISRNALASGCLVEPDVIALRLMEAAALRKKSRFTRNMTETNALAASVDQTKINITTAII